MDAEDRVADAHDHADGHGDAGGDDGDDAEDDDVGVTRDDYMQRLSHRRRDPDSARVKTAPPPQPPPRPPDDDLPF